VPPKCDERYDSNVPQRERYIVTVKKYPNDGSTKLFKIVGPKGTGIQIRDTHGLEDRFLEPFRNGAKEIEVSAYLRPDGRWHLVRDQEIKVTKVETTA
jgi:hypothetical protein